MIDDRILLRFADAVPAGAYEAVLIEGDCAAPAGVTAARFHLSPLGRHAVGCVCCRPRGPVAEALGRLFMARARGEVAWFTAVVAMATTEHGRAAIAAALVEDPVIAGRFRAAT